MGIPFSFVFFKLVLFDSARAKKPQRITQRENREPVSGTNHSMRNLLLNNLMLEVPVLGHLRASSQLYYCCSSLFQFRDSDTLNSPHAFWQQHQRITFTLSHSAATAPTAPQHQYYNKQWHPPSSTFCVAWSVCLKVRFVSIVIQVLRQNCYDIFSALTLIASYIRTCILAHWCVIYYITQSYIYNNFRWFDCAHECICEKAWCTPGFKLKKRERILFPEI